VGCRCGWVYWALIQLEFGLWLQGCVKALGVYNKATTVCEIMVGLRGPYSVLYEQIEPLYA
jgi:hypothetical protein